MTTIPRGICAQNPAQPGKITVISPCTLRKNGLSFPVIPETDTAMPFAASGFIGRIFFIDPGFCTFVPDVVLFQFPYQVLACKVAPKPLLCTELKAVHIAYT